MLTLIGIKDDKVNPTNRATLSKIRQFYDYQIKVPITYENYANITSPSSGYISAATWVQEVHSYG